MTTYMVAKAVFSERPSAYGGGMAKVGWKECPEYGKHQTNIAAKRVWAIAMGLAEADAPDDHCKRHFDAQYRNMGHFKIVKVAPPNDGACQGRLL